jgi:xanthine dehydrogenase YagR molybdenum-binding subunit
MTRKLVKSVINIENKEKQFIGEVSLLEQEKWGSNDTLKVIGKSIPRTDAEEKINGSALFTSDLSLPGQLYGKFLRSPFPSAKIVKIDIAKAKNLKGVKCILTNENTSKYKWYYDTSFLFDPVVRYEGEEVAFVAAESEEIAEEAIGLIEVEYNQLPFIVNTEKAAEEKNIKIHSWGNIVEPGEYKRGSVETGFSQADFVVEDEFRTVVVVHNPTEPHCSVVNWEGDDLVIYDSTQAVFQVRELAANVLGIPQEKTRVIKKYMGGGFGSKLNLGKYTIAAALASKETSKPVKVVLDRKEQNLCVGNRPDSIQKYKAGIKKDGTLTALKLDSFGTVGAYPEGAELSWPAKTLYKCPNILVNEKGVLTNTGNARAFRAPGHVQGIFGLESFMDECAEKAGINPLDFRLKNYTEIDPVSNQPYTTKKLKEAYKKAAALIGWENWAPAGNSKGVKKIGLGMASQIWWGGGGPPAHANIKLDKNGKFTIFSGTQDLGTGTYTFIAMVASEVLQIPIEKFEVVIGDTKLCPYAPLSGGSMTAPSVSPAVRDAAERLKQKLIDTAAILFNEESGSIKYAEGFCYNNDSSKKLSITEIAAHLNEEDLLVKGSRNENPKDYAINTFGAQFAKVEVDTLTGIVKVLKISASYDIGRVLNELTLENQIRGGIIMGLGYALMEERIIDENAGKVLTTNLNTYKIPTMKDLPEIVIEIASDYDPLISNTGVKGVGEPAIIPTAGAIANAVYNALGVRIKSLPITPDKVLNALYA